MAGEGVIVCAGRHNGGRSVITTLLSLATRDQARVISSAANRLIGEVVQSRRRPLLVGAFNQEKALVGAFSVIVQPVVEPMDRFAALPTILYLFYIP